MGDGVTMEEAMEDVTSAFSCDVEVTLDSKQ